MQCHSPKELLKQIPLAAGAGDLLQFLPGTPLKYPNFTQDQVVKLPRMGYTVWDGSIPLVVAQPKLSDCILNGRPAPTCTVTSVNRLSVPPDSSVGFATPSMSQIKYCLACTAEGLALRDEHVRGSRAPNRLPMPCC